MADHVLVQTESQLRTLKSRFNRHGELVRNPVKISETDMKGWGKHDERETILWIGRTDMFHKRPLLFLELAKRCPDLPFVMIVNNTNDTMFTDISTKCPPNLTIVDYVPHKEIWDYYRRARVFVSTSASGYEGFPNTFLQCAVTGVPMASLEVDPEGIFSQKNCGLLSGGSMDKLESDVRFLWSDEVHAQRYTKLFYKYTLEHHSLGRQVDRFEKLLQKVIDAPLRTPMLPWWKMPFQRFVRRLEI
ncbi:hypothetical protein BOW51_10405 [Solemya velesiana gill symbiont]|uniref:Glycosyl transferase family 1 domain-containing protein n=2 Tax=Solemya velesiana gill symbiont TaxID=1918948 RepID=A0A1T2KSJ4_9GAMM|nr:hypothetical protein BOW51_10405 [Solemya velesiana gill symbiont]